MQLKKVAIVYVKKKKRMHKNYIIYNCKLHFIVCFKDLCRFCGNFFLLPYYNKLVDYRVIISID